MSADDGIVARGQQVEPLITRLRTILEQYSDYDCIAREFLQNADDARATKVWFCLDTRSEVTPSAPETGDETSSATTAAPGEARTENTAPSTADSSSASQSNTPRVAAHLRHCTPALVVFNDSIFKDADWKSLGSIGCSVKKADATTTGRYGLGFNSCYHITDTPLILSRNQLQIFDPRANYFPVTKQDPGLFVKDARKILFADSAGLESSFNPFADVPANDQFTLFRLPLRSDIKSQLCCQKPKQPTTVDDINRIRQKFIQEAGKLTLFLRSVREVKWFEFGDGDATPRLLFDLTKSAGNGASDSSTGPVETFSLSIWDNTRPSPATHTEMWLKSTWDQKEAQQHASDLLTLEKEINELAEEDDSPHVLAKGAIAVRVQHPTDGILADIEGEVFCTLPLQVKTHLSFHCDAPFELSPDRKFILVRSSEMQNALEHKLRWNELTSQHVLADCFVNVFMWLKSRIFELDGSDPERCHSEDRLLPEATPVSDRVSTLFRFWLHDHGGKDSFNPLRQEMHQGARARLFEVEIIPTFSSPQGQVLFRRPDPKLLFHLPETKDNLAFVEAFLQTAVSSDLSVAHFAVPTSIFKQFRLQVLTPQRVEQELRLEQEANARNGRPCQLVHTVEHAVALLKFCLRSPSVQTLRSAGLNGLYLIPLEGAEEWAAIGRAPLFALSQDATLSALERSILDAMKLPIVHTAAAEFQGEFCCLKLDVTNLCTYVLSKLSGRDDDALAIIKLVWELVAAAKRSDITHAFWTKGVCHFPILPCVNSTRSQLCLRKWEDSSNGHIFRPLRPEDNLPQDESFSEVLDALGVLFLDSEFTPAVEAVVASLMPGNYYASYSTLKAPVQVSLTLVFARLESVLTQSEPTFLSAHPARVAALQPEFFRWCETTLELDLARKLPLLATIDGELLRAADSSVVILLEDATADVDPALFYAIVNELSPRLVVNPRSAEMMIAAGRLVKDPLRRIGVDRLAEILLPGLSKMADIGTRDAILLGFVFKKAKSTGAWQDLLAVWPWIPREESGLLALPKDLKHPVELTSLEVIFAPDQFPSRSFRSAIAERPDLFQRFKWDNTVEIESVRNYLLTQGAGERALSSSETEAARSCLQRYFRHLRARDSEVLEQELSSLPLLCTLNGVHVLRVPEGTTKIYYQTAQTPIVSPSEIAAILLLDAPLAREFQELLAARFKQLEPVDEFLRELGIEDIYDTFEQRVDLVGQINRILDDYTQDTIFKEFIQNADDAGADHVHIVFDQRSNLSCFPESMRRDGKPDPNVGPALLVMNNAPFTEKDLERIQQIGSADTKDRERIGQYGLGFNSVYRITDTPSFLTGDHIHFFDPANKFFYKRQGGRRHVTSSADSDFQVFRLGNLFDKDLPGHAPHACDLKRPFPGTLFRFPLRTSTSPPGRSVIAGNKVFSATQMNALLEAFQKEVPYLGLFLRHVRIIKLSVINNDPDAKPCRIFEFCNRPLSPSWPSDKPQEDCAALVPEKLKECATLLKTNSVPRQICGSLPVEAREIVLNSRPLADLPARPTLSSWQFLVGTAFPSDWGEWIPLLAATGASGKERIKSVPHAAVALRLPRRTSTDSKEPELPDRRLFCALPLPESLSPSFPAFVHAPFALDSSRSNFYNHNDTDLVRWNEKLLKVVAQAYREVLLHHQRFVIAQQGSASSPVETIFASWPQPSDKSSNDWSTQVLRHLASEIRNDHRFVFPCVRPLAATIQRSHRFLPLREVKWFQSHPLVHGDRKAFVDAVLDELVHTHQRAICYLPELLRHERPLGGPFQLLTVEVFKMLRELMKASQFEHAAGTVDGFDLVCYPSPEHALEYLRWAWSETARNDLLRDLPLVLLHDGSREFIPSKRTPLLLSKALHQEVIRLLTLRPVIDARCLCDIAMSELVESDPQLSKVLGCVSTLSWDICCTLFYLRREEVVDPDSLARSGQSVAILRDSNVFEFLKLLWQLFPSGNLSVPQVAWATSAASMHFLPLLSAPNTDSSQLRLQPWPVTYGSVFLPLIDQRDLTDIYLRLEVRFLDTSLLAQPHSAQHQFVTAFGFPEPHSAQHRYATAFGFPEQMTFLQKNPPLKSLDDASLRTLRDHVFSQYTAQHYYSVSVDAIRAIPFHEFLDGFSSLPLKGPVCMRSVLDPMAHLKLRIRYVLCESRQVEAFYLDRLQCTPVSSAVDVLLAEFQSHTSRTLKAPLSEYLALLAYCSKFFHSSSKTGAGLEKLLRFLRETAWVPIRSKARTLFVKPETLYDHEAECVNQLWEPLQLSLPRTSDFLSQFEDAELDAAQMMHLLRKLGVRKTLENEEHLLEAATQAAKRALDPQSWNVLTPAVGVLLPCITSFLEKIPALRDARQAQTLEQFQQLAFLPCRGPLRFPLDGNVAEPTATSFQSAVAIASSANFWFTFAVKPACLFRHADALIPGVKVGDVVDNMILMLKSVPGHPFYNRAGEVVDTRDAMIQRHCFFFETPSDYWAAWGATQLRSADAASNETRSLKARLEAQCRELSRLIKLTAIPSPRVQELASLMFVSAEPTDAKNDPGVIRHHLLSGCFLADPQTPPKSFEPYLRGVRSHEQIVSGQDMLASLLLQQTLKVAQGLQPEQALAALKIVASEINQEPLTLKQQELATTWMKVVHDRAGGPLAAFPRQDHFLLAQSAALHEGARMPKALLRELGSCVLPHPDAIVNKSLDLVKLAAHDVFILHEAAQSCIASLANEYGVRCITDRVRQREGQVDLALILQRPADAEVEARLQSAELPEYLIYALDALGLHHSDQEALGRRIAAFRVRCVEPAHLPSHFDLDTDPPVEVVRPGAVLNEYKCVPEHHLFLLTEPVKLTHGQMLAHLVLSVMEKDGLEYRVDAQRVKLYELLSRLLSKEVQLQFFERLFDDWRVKLPHMEPEAPVADVFMEARPPSPPAPEAPPAAEIVFRRHAPPRAVADLMPRAQVAIAQHAPVNIQGARAPHQFPPHAAAPRPPRDVDEADDFQYRDVGRPAEYAVFGRANRRFRRPKRAAVRQVAFANPQPVAWGYEFDAQPGAPQDDLAVKQRKAEAFAVMFVAERLQTDFFPGTRIKPNNEKRSVDLLLEDDEPAASLVWLNYEHDVQQPFDIRITVYLEKDATEEHLVEVQRGSGPNGAAVDISQAQWSLAKDHPNFHLVVVFGTEGNDIPKFFANFTDTVGRDLVVDSMRLSCHA
eukprot:m.912429 g.912429  ORF g.912429 m.912429 type:complete len:3185 (-) comp60114_c1_seq2:181-9735(-)